MVVAAVGVQGMVRVHVQWGGHGQGSRAMGIQTLTLRSYLSEEVRRLDQSPRVRATVGVIHNITLALP